MMPKPLRTLAFAAAMVMLLAFVSLRYELALDGADTTYAGFPLPWHARLPAASLATEVFLVPLGVNLLLYGWVARHLVKLMERLPGRAARRCAAALIAGGCVIGLLTLVVLSLYDVFYLAWPLPGPFTVTAVYYDRWW
ncbi:hypothetical protein IP92_04774 [Pseudoduganella flava]|uniref:Uncharacterized protein n=1 Tax=Pseudoduganella flava TaxID=871742 RepID=A0A562PH10_9BURK|nr:hypothetical protein [Pseudoduganella flava]QGZ42570.1 hypothetical protein GO485_28400 [Pseudoduganella flava]TWI43721.1 hypothetical protein IP92_04774 [Pseudoduganella flava]